MISPQSPVVMLVITGLGNRLSIIQLQITVPSRYNAVNFIKKYSPKTPHSSPVRVSYGVSFVGPAFNWYSTSVLETMYAIYCYTGPRYNGTRLYYTDRCWLHYLWLWTIRNDFQWNINQNSLCFFQCEIYLTHCGLATLWCHGSASSLVQTMAWHWIRANWAITWANGDIFSIIPRGTNFKLNFDQNITFSVKPWKCIWICHLQNGDLFVQAHWLAVTYVQRQWFHPLFDILCCIKVYFKVSSPISLLFNVSFLCC